MRINGEQALPAGVAPCMPVYEPQLLIIQLISQDLSDIEAIERQPVSNTKPGIAVAYKLTPSHLVSQRVCCCS
jgi:hypothetical protein